MAITRRASVIVVLLVAGLAPSGAMGERIQVRAAPTVSPNVYELDGQPESITRGPDGNMWATLSGNSQGNDLVRIKPQGGRTYYDLQNAPNPKDIVALGGRLWVTVAGGVADFTPANPTAASTSTIPGFVAGSIAVGFDGELVAAGDNTVWTIDPDDPLEAEFNQVLDLQAREIVRGTDGRIWVADASGRIVAINANGTEIFHEVGGNPQGIAAGPGGQVFYTNPGSDPQTIGLLKANGTPKKIELGNLDPSFSTTRARDGNYWVGFFNSQKVARVTPKGQMKTFGTEFPGDFRPRHVSAGPNGTVWIALQNPGEDGAIGVVRKIPAADGHVAAAVLGKKVRFDPRTRRGAVRIKCLTAEVSPPCRAKVKLVRNGKVLGKATVTVSRGKTKAAKVKVEPQVIGRIRRADNYRLTVKAQLRDGAGNSKTVRKKFKAVIK